MKAISIWAHQHTIFARSFIVCIYIFLNIIGLFLGDLIHSMNVVLSAPFYLFALSLTLVGLFIYPSKKVEKKYKNYYERHKSADCFLVIATFLFIIYSGNSFNEKIETGVISSYANTPGLRNIKAYHATEKTSFVAKKSFAKQLRAKLKQLRKAYKTSTKTEKTVYIILTLLAAAGLIILLGGLSCSIACSGSEALAYIVFFVGLGGIIYGAIKLIQHITGRKNKKTSVLPTN